MSIRAAIATTALSLVTLTAGCSSETDGTAAAGVPTPATTTSTLGASAAASRTDEPLSVSWIPRLEELALESCRGNPFTGECMSDALQLQTAAIELGGEANRRGDTIVKAEAVKVTADLQQYTTECVTSSPGSAARSRCLSLLVRLPNTHEGLVHAIYESEAK